LKSGAKAAYEQKDSGTWGACRTISPIHIAIKKQNEPRGINIIKCLLEAGAKIDACESEYDWRGCGGATSAWEMAASSENVELVRLFLKHGGNANSPSTSSQHSMRTDGHSEWYMLHTAVERNNIEMVKALIEGGANVDAKKSDVYHNERGYNKNSKATSLHIATHNGNLEIVKLLVNAGADVNTLHQYLEHVQNTEWSDEGNNDPRADDYIRPVVCLPVEETALAMAIQGKHNEIANFLAFHGADPSINKKIADASLTIPELCCENGVLIGWTPAVHRVLPPKAKLQVMCALLCFSRQQEQLPRPIVEMVLRAAISIPII
jgi:ankyrin repeat protein